MERAQDLLQSLLYYTTFILTSNTFTNSIRLFAMNFPLFAAFFLPLHYEQTEYFSWCTRIQLLKLIFIRISIKHQIEENLITRIHTWWFRFHRFVLLLIFLTLWTHFLLYKTKRKIILNTYLTESHWKKKKTYIRLLKCFFSLVFAFKIKISSSFLLDFVWCWLQLHKKIR